jgi:subtilase family serine protease
MSEPRAGLYDRRGVFGGVRIGRLIAVVICLTVAIAGTATAATGAAKPAQRRVVLLGLSQRGHPIRLAREVSNPASPRYRRFLTLRQYVRRFSATPQVRREVLSYLRSQPGVVRVQVSGDRSVIMAIVTPQAGRRLFCARGSQAPAGGLCKPRAIRRFVRQISVGELYQLGAPVGSGSAGGPRPTPAAAHNGCAAATAHGAFTPRQLSTAYGVDPLHARGLNGSGVRVATLSSQEVNTSGFSTWARCFGLRPPAVRQLAMPGASLATATAPEETVLDIEALASLAPRLQRIIPIFVPLDQSFSNSFLLFMFGALDPARQGGTLPNVLSISDGVCESRFTRGQLGLGERLLAETAALGITAMSASGDLGFQGCFINKPGTAFPASSPFTTAVGGTTLTLTRADRIARQVVWSTFATAPAQGVGSGGGPSKVWRRPGFQRAPGIGPQLQRATRTRLIPDIAAMASFTPGMAVFDQDGGGWGIGGGTSAATPLEAAIVALVLQQERRAGRPPVGSLPPLLYQLARGAGYHTIFFDITHGTSSRHPRSAVGRSPAGGAAQAGYDLATGLGSLNAAAFANAVAARPPSR